MKWLLSGKNTFVLEGRSFFFIPFLEIVRIVDCSFPLDIKKKKMYKKGFFDSSLISTDKKETIFFLPRIYFKVFMANSNSL